MAAVSAINELFYRQRTLPFPHTIVNGLKILLKHLQSSAASELYQDKCIELLQQFMAQQCSKWINDEQHFSEIVTLLHGFTFASEFRVEYTLRAQATHWLLESVRRMN